MTTRAPARPQVAPLYEYMSLAAFRDVARDGNPGDVLLRKAVAIAPPLVLRAEDGTETRRIRTAITSERIDREEDTIAVDGWELANYRRNPVVLWAHDYHSLPIARSLRLYTEETELDGESVRLMFSEDEFPALGLHPFADLVYALTVGGYINATSVGFRPLTWSFDEERWGVNFLTQEMLEHSYVPIPANPDALIAARAAGIVLDPLKEWAELALARMHGEPGTWLPQDVVVRALRIVENGRRSMPAASVREPEATVETPPILSAEDEHTDEGEHVNEQAQIGRVEVAGLDIPVYARTGADGVVTLSVTRDAETQAAGDADGAGTPPAGDEPGGTTEEHTDDDDEIEWDGTEDELRELITAGFVAEVAAQNARVRGRLD